MRAAGVAETTAKAMYGAVYNFAPRWGVGSTQHGPAAAKYRTEEQQAVFFNELKAWIERENPTAEQIAKGSGRIRRSSETHVTPLGTLAARPAQDVGCLGFQ
jgi:hypothetical protein